MAKSELNTEKSIFLRAMEIVSPVQRSKFLDSACQNAPELRLAVEALLEANQREGDLLDAIGRTASIGSSENLQRQKKERPKILGDFEIIREIGRGGMGVVFEARQISLNRKVALKVLATSLGSSQKAIARFRGEAEAAAKLHHTNIVPIYATGEDDGIHFYAMELVSGPSLKQIIEHSKVGQSTVKLGGPLEDTQDTEATEKVQSRENQAEESESAGETSRIVESRRFERIARWFSEVADALHHAHGRNVIHRDIKPSNLLLLTENRLTVSDFGLARILDRPGVTVTGEFIGSPLYMSPEQIAAGRVPIDHRTDIYSLGAALYEILTLAPPFPGNRRDEVIAKVIQKEPLPPRRLNGKIPADLQTICLKALEKDPENRYESAAEMAEDLRRYADGYAIRARPPSFVTQAVKFVRRNKIQVAVTTAVLMLFFVSIVFILKFGDAQQRSNDQEWLRITALPAIENYVAAGQFEDAFELAHEAEKRVPNDPALEVMREQFSRTLTIVSDPPNAKVYRRPYGNADAKWKFVGTTPLPRTQVPIGFNSWKVIKSGFEEFEGCRAPESRDENTLSFNLNPIRRSQPGMVLVSGGNLYGRQFAEFFIDRTEVTNRQYKEFVEGGGYHDSGLWKDLVYLDGEKELPWQTAVETFIDATGEFGPATWRDGMYPTDEDDYPVRGISWYEAVAYSRFRGKDLPTIAHWQLASGVRYAHWMETVSNFDVSGPATCGSFSGIGPYGTADSAGNVKEWCWNQGPGDSRYILGGSWDEPEYMFAIRDSQSAMGRLNNYGFRCVKYLQDVSPNDLKPVIPKWHNYSHDEPVSSEAFDVIRASIYSYENKKLDPEHASIDRTAMWTEETVTFAAAYGDSKERVIAHVYLPTRVEPPYQAILYWPGIYAYKNEPFRNRTFRPDHLRVAAFVNSGRAVVYPIHAGCYERYSSKAQTQVEYLVQQRKDLGRTIDYLNQREDIDLQKLSFVGFSSGARNGINLVAVESRISVAVFVHGGLPKNPDTNHAVSGVNFAPHIKVPALMINGRNDFIFPAETSQRPLFELLGTSPSDKDYRVFEGGHNVPLNMQIQETIGWLDRYLGTPPKVDELERL
ncbi:protein kinase [Stieleria sp. ICT_E10.1]|uniref:protein kinase domain-containing protein n=1 Tax=Stieleria sedimenti TaxID=2976331 RepID=UPI00217FA46C|nr:protein kinase [Stieleria sedimenti]MCS7466054.1 protein kinase [Stieleria sedimenti]